MATSTNRVSTVHSGRSRSSPPDAKSGAAWRDRAACRAVDPELFFPVGDSGPALAQVAEAKAVCARCPVTAQCLAFALLAIPEGVAGGLTSAERRHHHRRSPSPAARAVGVSSPRERGVTPGVVAELMTGHPVPGASPIELERAAIGLHTSGHGARSVATRLGVGERRVHRWLRRHRTTTPLTPPTGTAPVRA